MDGQEMLWQAVQVLGPGECVEVSARQVHAAASAARLSLDGPARAADVHEFLARVRDVWGVVVSVDEGSGAVTLCRPDGARPRLARLVPAHVDAVEFLWVQREFVPMGPSYRAARNRSNDPMLRCRWCAHEFVDGEMVALARPDEPGEPNWVLCQFCAREAVAAAGWRD